MEVCQQKRKYEVSGHRQKWPSSWISTTSIFPSQRAPWNKSQTRSLAQWCHHADSRSWARKGARGRLLALQRLLCGLTFRPGWSIGLGRQCPCSGSQRRKRPWQFLLTWNWGHEMFEYNASRLHLDLQDAVTFSTLLPSVPALNRLMEGCEAHSRTEFIVKCPKSAWNTDLSCKTVKNDFHGNNQGITHQQW